MTVLAHTTKRAALAWSRRDLSIDASLGICTLPVADKISCEISPRGRVGWHIARLSAI